MNTKPTQYLINILLYTEPKVRSQRHRWSKSYLGPHKSSVAWAGVLMHLFVSYCLVSTLYFYCIKLHSEVKANLLSMLQMGVLFKNLNRTGIISHVCYMKHKTYIYFYSHLLFYVCFFFKINMKIYLKNNLFIHLFCICKIFRCRAKGNRTCWTEN